MPKVRKHDILDAWAMLERLSEGDINFRDPSLMTLQNLENGDYRTLFLTAMERRGATRRRRGGIVLYIGRIRFQDVLDRLRAHYCIPPTYCDAGLGDKFRLALYFDKDLNLDAEKSFLTESAVILNHKGAVPDEDEFEAIEERLRERLEEVFSDAVSSPQDFNGTVARIMRCYSAKEDDCRMRPVEDLDSDAVNLHSFFLDDLSRAKSVDTPNLERYLFGFEGERVCLDTKRDSPNFNPQAVEDAMRPERYPLGRYPSNTRYSLSLMQQVAVNLATDLDGETVRSVNGPPGTGKTTLLKDVFADLVVKQAETISHLKKKTIPGDEDSRYYKHGKIGVLPDRITENSIVVASSNNGAVQNIVNGLPLMAAVDEGLLDELMGADYFTGIANGDADPPLLWGLFSMEGGRKGNMDRIVEKAQEAYEHLDKDYRPDPSVYSAFLKDLQRLEEMRGQAQKRADHIATLPKAAKACELAKERADGLAAGLDEKMASIARRSDDRQMAINKKLSCINSVVRRDTVATEALEADLDVRERQWRTLAENPPGLLAGLQARREYREALRIQRGLIDQATEQLSNARKTLAGHQRTQERLATELDAVKDSCKTEQEEARRAVVRATHKAQHLASEVERLRDLCRDGGAAPLDLDLSYDELQLSAPWFDRRFREAQSRLFVSALKVRKQFLYDNRKNLRHAVNIWKRQNPEKPHLSEAAFGWLNLLVPVIGSTFASFSRMGANLGPQSLGHVFVDEAGQALPQAAVGAVMRSRHFMAVGDPAQIKPVLTLDSNVLDLLADHFHVGERYLSDSASVQTLADAASRHGFHRTATRDEDSWIGIPLWVHRRCKDPMFTISNQVSYGGLMVQGAPGAVGAAGWYDVGGKAIDKYVGAQGDLVADVIADLMTRDPRVGDASQKDMVYVISPFANVAHRLAKRLDRIGFTRYGPNNKPTNVGTIHTFQGKEAATVFLVLGADESSTGAARWAVSEPNMMNVAATRAKEAFYIVGDKELYLGLDSRVIHTAWKIIEDHGRKKPPHTS